MSHSDTAALVGRNHFIAPLGLAESTACADLCPRGETSRANGARGASLRAAIHKAIAPYLTLRHVASAINPLEVTGLMYFNSSAVRGCCRHAMVIFVGILLYGAGVRIT
jgi:hypothetical protein